MNMHLSSFISLLIVAAAASRDDLPISSVVRLPNGPLRNPGKPAAIAATARPPKPPPPASSSDFLARRPSGVLGGLTAPNRPSEEVTSDCITMRRVMISRHGNASQLSGYVPVCTGPDDKLYDAVQCHKATGYCWCVNQATNYPIPNTSTLGKPNCTALRLRPRTSFRRQTIKGCKPRKQAAFFQRFFRSIETEMIAAIGPQRSKQRIDRIAKWKFRQLDANKNKVLEKEEWKPYRGELRQFNKMRRCGRNFFRFCDQDRNKKITFDEWRRCTVDATRKKPRKKVEKTQNPFLYILRPEE